MLLTSPRAIRIKAIYSRIILDQDGKEAWDLSEFDLVIPKPRTAKALGDSVLIYHTQQTQIHQRMTEAGFSLFQIELFPRKPSN